ncbi:MAG: hypothetical protein ACXWQO_00150 [Bdellovibrionota bacterium]
MEQSKKAWSLLSEAIGTYRGSGINHEGQNFTGTLKLETAYPGKLLGLRSNAIGSSGEVFHDEVSWIGKDLMGALTLYVTSNNHPGVTAHVFDRLNENSEAKEIIFRFGDPQNRNSFREEITFSLFSDGSLAHHYAWGMPGGDFAPRSGSRMQRSQ